MSPGLGCVQLWAPAGKASLGRPGRKSCPQCPAPVPHPCPGRGLLGSDRWSVGPSVHERQQQPRAVVVADQERERRKVLRKQFLPSPDIPLPILSASDWPTTLWQSQDPPEAGRMGQARSCFGCRKVLSGEEAVLSTDVALSRGPKRSQRRLLLLQDQLVVAKLHRGTALRPRLCLALQQLWVLSTGKEAVLQPQQEQQQQGSDEDAKDATSIILIWPTGSCIATFGSQALKELWVDTLEGSQGARVTRVPSIKGLEKELSRCHAGRTLSTTRLERLIADLEEVDPQQEPEEAPSAKGQGLDLSKAAGTGGSSGSGRTRRRWLPWPFALRQGPAGAARAPGQEGSGCSRALFGQPLAAVCAEDGTLPRPMQELLAVLHQEGPPTEGIFRKAESAKAQQELQQALDHGLPIDMASQLVLLLACILKDFLRSIPGKLLVTDLYEDWMAAMQMASREDKICQLKAVAKKLPAANLLLLRQLLALLRHIGQHESTSRMSCSNLAICLGPNLLSPPQEEQLELEAMLAENNKVKALVDFLLESSQDILGEEMAGPSESPAPTEMCTEMHLEEESGPAGREDEEAQAKSNPEASPSLPDVWQEDGGEATVLEAQRAEAPPPLSPNTHQSSTELLAKAEALTSLSASTRLVGCYPVEEEKRR